MATVYIVEQEVILTRLVFPTPPLQQRSTFPGTTPGNSFLLFLNDNSAMDEKDGEEDVEVIGEDEYHEDR